MMGAPGQTTKHFSHGVSPVLNLFARFDLARDGISLIGDEGGNEMACDVLTLFNLY
jgi:hypothetical protein